MILDALIVQILQRFQLEKRANVCLCFDPIREFACKASYWRSNLFCVGNCPTVFITANPIVVQSNLLPLDVYERRTYEERYLDAREEGRIHKHYHPLTSLLAEWADRALPSWEANHG